MSYLEAFNVHVRFNLEKAFPSITTEGTCRIGKIHSDYHGKT